MWYKWPMAKEIWMSIRMDEDEKARLLALAQKTERTLASQVRVFIREGLDRAAKAAA